MTVMDDRALVPLPSQPAGVPWPTSGPDGWPVGAAPAWLTPLIDELVDDTEQYGTTYAVLVVHGGVLVVERYGGALPHFDRPPEPVTATTLLLSWSMAKSILHAAVGLLVADGLLALDEPAPVPAWQCAPDDPRRTITLEHLLAMRDGLDFAEDYVDARVSDVIEMLFGSGQLDVAAYAEARPLRHEPGMHFNYSSGTSNIVSAIAARAVGGGDALVELMRRRIFDRIGMGAVDARQDAAGTFIGSSYLYATARDFARFGLLALRGGHWNGEAVLPDGWIDHGRRPRSVDADGDTYGAHWWVVGDEHGSFRASGFEGQSILACPARDLLVVRLGYSPEAMYPALRAWRAQVVLASAREQIRT
jgi:CubicO group peptidase (beta-lactamase class C family)